MHTPPTWLASLAKVFFLSSGVEDWGGEGGGAWQWSLETCLWCCQSTIPVPHLAHLPKLFLGSACFVHQIFLMGVSTPRRSVLGEKQIFSGNLTILPRIRILGKFYWERWSDEVKISGSLRFFWKCLPNIRDDIQDFQEDFNLQMVLFKQRLFELSPPPPLPHLFFFAVFPRLGSFHWKCKFYSLAGRELYYLSLVSISLYHFLIVLVRCPILAVGIPHC